VKRKFGLRWQVYLDSELNEEDFARVAELLKQANWSQTKTEETLVQLIAPHAGANLGYLIWPVSGAWAGFNETWICERVRRSKSLRASRPHWHFLLSDWLSKRMLHQLGINRLLERI
jgi:hypothetical protein